jgi:flagellar hook-associated protein 1 FlgK
MDFQTVRTSQGLSLTTDNGTPLVVGSQAYALTNQMNASGYNSVLAGGVDVTGSIAGGTLGGNLAVRNQSLPGIKSQLDQLAFQFASAVNSVQEGGAELKGSAGTAVFNPPDTVAGSATGAAAAMTLALTSGSQLAAAATGAASGDGSNLTRMIALQSQPVINGSTPDNAFAQITYSVGSSISEANSNATATGNILTQLQNQQSSVEGVSTDEESANLLLYERSYQAAAKVISTIDTLMGNILDVGVTNPGY